VRPAALAAAAVVALATGLAWADQIATAPGEWALYVDVAGIWTHVRPLVLCVRDGQFGNSVGDDRPGYVAARGTLGRHDADASLKDSTCPASNRLGCYRLSWRVVRLP
jgi:hypothetical protein